MKNKAFRPHARGVKQALGELEAAIMEYLWKNGPQSPAEVHRALSERSQLAYTTVFTELSRLLKKGLVRKRGRYRDTRYAAAQSRDAFVASLVAQVFGGLIEAHGKAAIHGFVDVIADDPQAMTDVARLLRKRNNTTK